MNSLNFHHDATRIRVHIKAYNIIIKCDGVIEIGARVSDHFHFHCDVAGNSIELGFWWAFKAFAKQLFAFPKRLFLSWSCCAVIFKTWIYMQLQDLLLAYNIFSSYTFPLNHHNILKGCGDSNTIVKRKFILSNEARPFPPLPNHLITIEYLLEIIKQNHNNEDSFNNSQVVNEQ